MRVFVYRNLHIEGNVYSLKALDGISKGHVIGHAHGIHLKNCELIVSEAGRQRVLKTRRKNVHAGIVGDLVTVCDYRPRIHNADLIKTLTQLDDAQWVKTFPQGTPVTYNPFLYTKFVIKGSATPILRAKEITFFHDRVEALKI